MKKKTLTALTVILTGAMLAAGCGKGSAGADSVGAENSGEESSTAQSSEAGSQGGPENSEDAQTSTTGDQESGENAQAPTEGAVEFQAETYEKGFQAEDSQTLVELKIAYPMFGNGGEADKAMNDAVSGLIKNYEAQASESAEMLKTDNMYKEESTLLPYGFEAGFTVTYNQGGYLQIRFNGYDYTGGAHGNPWEQDLLFDVSDGRQLSAEDVFVSPEAERAAYIQAFTKKYEENPDIFFPDALDTLNGEEFQPGFYLAQDGVHFYAMPYELGPYATGTIEVTAPYSKELVKLDIQ